MVYISSWHQFQQAAEALYDKSPERTRYVVKWKPSQAALVLKITDDDTCLKFRTHSSIMLGRFEMLNLELMRKMQNRIAPPPADPVVELAASSEQPAASTTASSGTKKKKAKKKK